MQAAYQRWQAEVSRVLDSGDYDGALKYYADKGLAAEAGHVFGTKYREQVLRWLRADDSNDLIAALRSAVPQVQDTTPASP